MKKAIVGAVILALIGSPVFAKGKCKFSEGDAVQESGKYLLADSCTLVGNVEAVNKDCTKLKMSVNKVTGAFGMKVDAICRYKGGEAKAGDTVWVSID